jgi:succinyl-CoA synthetase beta subunit
MMLVEYEGKDLLADARIPVPPGVLLTDIAELRSRELPYPLALKVQVAASGRGREGGVLRCADLAEAEANFDKLVSLEFAGEHASSILAEPWLTVEREFYLAVTIDTRVGGYSLFFCPTGGVDIESRPDLLQFPIGNPRAFRLYDFRKRLITSCECEPTVRERIVLLAGRLLSVAQTHECITVEVNPLGLLSDGSLVAMDAKVVLDDSAAFRKRRTARAIVQLSAKQDELVRQCFEANLMLVPLDGNIGLISSGAGMTMAAMDALEAGGGRPACFLDMSSNPTPLGFRHAFRMLDSDNRISAILISMFGGGMHTDRVARTLVELLAGRTSRKPVVMRLNGTGSEAAGEILLSAGYANHSTLEDAVSEVVRLGGSHEHHA